MLIRMIGAAAGAWMMAGAAIASEGFEYLSLGLAENDEECLEIAAAVNWYTSELAEAGNEGATDSPFRDMGWWREQYDVGQEGIDVLIFCAYGPDDKSHIGLVVYNAPHLNDAIRYEAATGIVKAAQEWRDYLATQ